MVKYEAPSTDTPFAGGVAMPGAVVIGYNHVHVHHRKFIQGVHVTEPEREPTAVEQASPVIHEEQVDQTSIVTADGYAQTDTTSTERAVEVPDGLISEGGDGDTSAA